MTADLVSAAQAGDDHAFADLVRLYQDMAVAYATSILGDFHLAEDAAQEAFVEAYRALPALRDPGAFAAWFRCIVFKHCDRFTRRRQPALTSLDAATAIASQEPSPHEALEQHELRRSLNAAIATLPEHERTVVLLYYMGDHAQSSIADFLGVTPNVVKTRLYSARQRLKAHMSEIEKNLGNARPSSDRHFADRVARLIQPDELKGPGPWIWSPGIGPDVWALFLACAVGDLAKVKQLLDADPSLARSHLHYHTPLHFAVRENQLAVAEYLLDHGAEPLNLGNVLEDARDREYRDMERLIEHKLATVYGASAKGDPVAAAIRDRDRDRVRRLLDADPSLLHAGDSRSSQPIHWAAMTRNLGMIDDLLARGADIDARRADGARPLQLTNGDYHYRGWRDVPREVTTTPDDVYRHLVKRGAYVDIGMAAAKGDVDRVRMLLAEDPGRANRLADYHSGYRGGGAPLKNAAASGSMEIVKLLLDHGADPNLPEEQIAPHGHALYGAVSNGHYEIAKLLLDRGAYPNPAVESSADVVWIAIRDGDERMLRLLASHGAVWEIPIGDGRLNYEQVLATGVGISVVVLAHFGDVARATPLFDENPALADNPEALEKAASTGHEDFVRLLLRHQPSLAKRVRVSSPRAMAELLFAHGMDANLPSWLRVTPLHTFAADGNLEAAALYIDHGAELDARDENYRSTPLGYAARTGRTRMVELLLRRGAKLTLPDDPPWATPLAWARKRGHEDIVKLLTDFDRSGMLPSHSRDEYDALVRDLIDAFQTGAEAPVRRLLARFRVGHMPQTVELPPADTRIALIRGRVREKLGWRATVMGSTLALNDARTFIAQAEGVRSWEQLMVTN
jgi:RNA polymerase sigma factor (sigma-70 family)